MDCRVLQRTKESVESKLVRNFTDVLERASFVKLREMPPIYLFGIVQLLTATVVPRQLCRSWSKKRNRAEARFLADEDCPERIYMWATMLSPNSEHLISVAPCIMRAKS